MTERDEINGVWMSQEDVRWCLDLPARWRPFERTPRFSTEFAELLRKRVQGMPSTWERREQIAERRNFSANVVTLGFYSVNNPTGAFRGMAVPSA